MGQICDCLFRTHQHNRLNEIEDKIRKYEPVSYTHLTLPTIREV